MNKSYFFMNILMGILFSATALLLFSRLYTRRAGSKISTRWISREIMTTTGRRNEIGNTKWGSSFRQKQKFEPLALYLLRLMDCSGLFLRSGFP